MLKSFTDVPISVKIRQN